MWPQRLGWPKLPGLKKGKGQFKKALREGFTKELVRNILWGTRGLVLKKGLWVGYFVKLKKGLGLDWRLKFGVSSPIMDPKAWGIGF